MKLKWLLVILILLLVTGGVVISQQARDSQPAAPQYPVTELNKQPTCKVVRVVDGDTVVLNMGNQEVKVRLVGVDTPEINEPYYKEATEFLSNLLMGEEVYIEVKGDGDAVDIHGRLLLYLYRVPDGLVVNLELVRQGYGRISTFPFKYKDLFLAYEQRAKKSLKGLWANQAPAPAPANPDSQPPAEIVKWQNARSYIGQTKTVEGLIVRTYSAGTACFLNFDSRPASKQFYVVIFPEDYDKFPSPPATLYKNKKIRVRGMIEKYRGKPQIVVKDPGQIEIVK